MANQKTDSTKYGKLLKKEPFGIAEFAPNIRLPGGEIWGGLPIHMSMKCFTEPYIIEEETHAHDYDIVLGFIGSNPLYFKEFDAEIELFLGEEHEKHIIDCTTFVHIPKGMLHCPLNFKRVSKPFIFLNISLTADIKRTVGPPPKKMIPKYDTNKYKI
jgi:hypothetical protein